LSGETVFCAGCGHQFLPGESRHADTTAVLMSQHSFAYYCDDCQVDYDEGKAGDLGYLELDEEFDDY